MSFFDPQTILLGLIKSLGISPAQIQSAYAQLTHELTTLAAERVAFKTASGQAVQHFSARLDAQDARLERIESLVSYVSGRLPPSLSYGTVQPVADNRSPPPESLSHDGS